MINRLKIVAGLVTLILLAAGVYFVSDIYAQHEGDGKCKDGGKCKEGGCGKHGEGGGQPSQPSDSANPGTPDDSNSPNKLLKTADKLLKEAEKTKNVASLMKHCEQMLNKAAEIMTECTQVTEGHGWFDGQSVDLAAKLMKKCLDMTSKSQSLIPKDQKKSAEEKVVYKCPMGCETSDKPGKCSKCGMNLEKAK
jgi:hypothetical protein